jgi:inosine-uridine nucleoside N-ribohydrolase
VWVDADPSGLVWSGLDCDDDLAIIAVLSQHLKSLLLTGISICGGNAPLTHTWDDMQALWKYIDFKQPSSNLATLNNAVPVVRGYGWRSMQVSRGWMKIFQFVSPDMKDSDDAVNAIINQVRDTKNLNILTLGPPTNVAKAIEKMDLNEHKHQIEHIYMMGGELTEKRLDLNFLSDRAAARSIIENEYIPKTLVTVQLCAQVVIDKSFVDRFENQCCQTTTSSGGGTEPPAAACAILPKMKQQVQLMPRYINPAVLNRMPQHGRWNPSPNLDKGFIPWDLIAVLCITHPQLFTDFEYHRVTLDTCSCEPCTKTMKVISNISNADILTGISNHSGIVRIPHTIKNETLVLETIHDMLCQVPASIDRNTKEPKMMLGFFGQMGGILILFIAMLCLRLVQRRSGKKYDERQV